MATDEKTEASLFAKWMMGVMASLIVIGIPATIVQAVQLNTQLATINIRLENLTNQVNEIKSTGAMKSEDLNATKITLAAVKMLMEKYTVNHTDLKRDVVSIELRVVDAEKRLSALEGK